MSETLLGYWREDPLFNEHHEHWHLVYPYAGRSDRKLHTVQELLDIAAEKRKALYLIWNDRHGELFAYMHSQLMARYSAERLSIGLPSVVSLDDYQQPIPDGYIPNVSVRSKNKLIVAGNRPDNTKLQDIWNSEFNQRPGAQVSSQERFRDRLWAAVDLSLANNRPTTISELAERIEATERLETTYFGALHNDGHILISMHNDDPHSPGCMFWEATAVRDPVFYRWHAHIDKFFRKYREALKPYDFIDLPAVEVARLTIAAASGQQDELITEMRVRALRSTEQPSVITNKQFINYLSHEDFAYVITAANTSDVNLTVTVRIFMAPEQFVDDRTAWIEMDKFRQVLPSGESTFKRESRSSSVVRHPVWTADMLEGREPGPNDASSAPGCRCGWPYTLLLPRGNPKGLPFRFITLLTPGLDLTANLKEEMSNASYCGLLDSEYPDRRPMGYPFDRPLRNSIHNWTAGTARPPQLASTIVNIKHIPQPVP